MKIRTQFLISLVLFAVMLAVIGISLFSTSAELDRASKQEITANDVAQGATELGYLANDYILNGEPQQRTRWETSFSQLTTALGQLDTTEPATATLVNDIKTNQQSLQIVFADVANTITTNPMTDPATHLAFVQVSWSRLQVPTQAIVFDASRLPNVFQDQTSQVHLRQLILLVAIVILMTGYFIANYFLVYRRTLRSVGELQTGARFIGSGNLDYVLPIKYDDEISDLARSFNKMTSNLKTVTASKSDLEQEVYKRAEAQEELHITNEELKIANENLQENAQKLELEMHEHAASEERFRGLFQKAPYAVALSSIPDGRYADVNEAFLKMSGYAREEVIGKNSVDLNMFPDPASRAKVVAELKEKNSVHDAEMIIRTRSGERCTVSATIEPVTLEGQNYWLAMQVDITDRKMAEEALRKSEELYRTLFENMLNGLAHCRMIFENGKPVDFQYLNVNRAFAELTGLKDVADKLVTEVIPGIRESNPELLETYGRVAMTGKPEVFETHIPDLDMWFSISAYSPKTGEFVAIFDVITARKKAEEALARSNQKVSEILASIQDSFYVLDRDWNFTYANQQFTSRIGKEPSDFIGRNFWQMFPNDIGTILEENFRATMEQRQIRRFEMGGLYTDASYRLATFPSAEGITVIAEDITNIKKAEESLRESYAEMERVNRAAVSRELRMIELKREINKYYIATGQPPRYMLDLDEDK